MANNKGVRDHELGKFTTDSVVRVTSGAGLLPEHYDKIAVTYPSTTVEVYTYTLAAASVGVVTVTYTDDTKEFLLTVERTS